MGEVQRFENAQQVIVGPRLARPEQLAEDEAQVVRSGCNQVPLANVREATQPTPPATAGVADVGERTLDQLASLAL